MTMCGSLYYDGNIYFPYVCEEEEGHSGPHRNVSDGPGMVWYGL